MPPSAAPTHRTTPLQASDLRGLARLGVDAVVGVTDIAEALHQTIVSRAAPVGPSAATRTSGITGLVYRSVRGTTRGVGRGLDALLGLMPVDASARRSAAREAWLAALNGVWGDHLEASANPLALPMRLRRQGQALTLTRQALAARIDAPRGRIAVMIHGLAMNDLQWLRRGHDHAAVLEAELGYTVLHLHYNSGRHVSHNGREFSGLLDDLVQAWPVAVQDLALVGHSMGGLVARSACHLGADAAWRAHLRSLVCLGTPHHGAPLERGGRLIDLALGISPYGAPFGRLGQGRSAGITDLRYGNLQDADWQAGRHRQHRDDRVPTPLPAGVAVGLVAATTADSAAGGLRNRLVGDGLVPLSSALGMHRDPRRALGVPDERRLVVTRADHWDLLDRPEVAAALRAWLA